MRRVVIGSTFVLAALAVGVLLTRRGRPSCERHVVEVDGTAREYVVVRPEGHTGPRPVLIAFHGTFDDPESFLVSSGLADLAVREDVLLIGPRAVRGMWFVDPPPGSEGESRDVRFFDALVEDVAKRWAVDRARVNVVGFSNGGEFAHRLAVARPDAVAGAVAWAGCLSAGEPTPKRCAPLLFVVGENDSPSRRKAIRDWDGRLRDSGCEASFHEVSDVAHEWSPAENGRVWRFLAERSHVGEGGE